MTTWRLLPPAQLPGAPAGSEQTVAVNGRTYTAAPGSVLDVPDFDGGALVAAGWTFVAPSGPTSGRPTIPGNATSPYPLGPGFDTAYYDTTVSALLWWDGANWRDAGGTSH